MEFNEKTGEKRTNYSLKKKTFVKKLKAAIVPEPSVTVLK